MTKPDVLCCPREGLQICTIVLYLAMTRNHGSRHDRIDEACHVSRGRMQWLISAIEQHLGDAFVETR